MATKTDTPNNGVRHEPTKSRLKEAGREGPEGWNYQGYNDQEPNDQALLWSGKFSVPGFTWSKKSLVAVERVEDPLDEPMRVAYYVGIYPFDENGEAPGLVQDRHTTGPYSSPEAAVENAVSYMEMIVEGGPGDEIVIGEQRVRIGE